ncbi:unnamed protein product [Arabidopsis thaliana]|uniref:(thale cress) hypothetical protein n=1 Tax=Arabidopsis thaliana TaxID=3702 RepID=A0A7G2E2U6_ARATH|nr:unnamed protein product [Arabidopsis thaliana]
MWSVMGLVRRTAMSSTVNKASPVRSLLGGFRCLNVESKEEDEKKDMTVLEAKKLMRLVNVEDMKKKLIGMGDKEMVTYTTLIEASQGLVYLHPHKVVDLIRKAVPLGLNPDDELIREEFDKMRSMKEEIDVLAHQQVRKILWGGLGYSVVQIGIFVRLTFWEFSWDVMEPITFFTTATGIIAEEVA